MTKTGKIILLIFLVVLVSIAGYFFTRGNETGETVFCTQEALMCPDGSYVGRTGPNCEFSVCPTVEVSQYKDLIRVATPLPESMISSPLVIKGEARGMWYFEVSFPVVLTNWDGLIIAEGIATAKGDWMTEDYVPFEATLEFESDTQVSNRGSLILQRSNASGLPEHDDAFEYTVYFSEDGKY